MGAARDRDPPGAEPHGVVVGDAARVPTAQAIGEVTGRAAPGGGRVGRGLREAAVVVDEVGGQEGFGRLDGRDAVPAQLGDEAVLQGFPEALDAALGLGRVGADVADREVSQDLAELGGVLGALELLLHAPVGVVADEDAEAIAVEGHRQPVARGETPEQGEIAVEILRGPEVQRQDGARRIVDGAEEQAGRSQYRLPQPK